MGTTNHCVHGPGMIVEEILDWRPIEYYTVRATPFGTIPLEITAELTPIEPDTRVTWRIRLPRGRKAKETWEAMREPMAAAFQQAAARMAELLAAERERSHEGADLPGPNPAGS